MNVRREIEKIKSSFERKRNREYINKLADAELAEMQKIKQQLPTANSVSDICKPNKILPHSVNDFIATATLDELEAAWQIREEIFTTKLCCAMVLSSIRYQKGIDVSQKLPLSLIDNESILKLDMDLGIEEKEICVNFNSSKIKRFTEVTTRKNQSEFRDCLLKCYGVCAITGSKIKHVLEAAHVVPFNGFNDHLNNGILLRSDIHKLFDSFLISIHPVTKELQLNQVVKKEYGIFKKIVYVTVSDENLNWHYSQFKKMKSTMRQ